MTFGTWLFTKLRGELVGTDDQGNRYYQDKRTVTSARRRKRWVIYQGEPEASRVPPDWHGWLHYNTNTAPPADGLPRKFGQKYHLRNLSGADLASRPPGSTLVNSPDKPKPPYEAWRPG